METKKPESWNQPAQAPQQENKKNCLRYFSHIIRLSWHS